MCQRMDVMKTEIIREMNSALQSHMADVNTRLNKHMKDIKEMIEAKESSSKQPHTDDGFNAFPILTISELERFNELMLNDDASKKMVILTNVSLFNQSLIYFI